MEKRKKNMIDRLPELAKFSERRGIKPGESFDLQLAATANPIRLFSSAKDMPAALDYQSVIGKTGNDFEIAQVDNPIKEATDLKEPGVIPLVIHSTIDPVLNRRMFADGPKLGQLLMGHLYRPEPQHESPMVHVVGISNQGLEIVNGSRVESYEKLEREMAIRRSEVLGNTRVSNDEFRDILRSRSVRKIIAHALGPTGTNISQAMALYIRTQKVEEKTNLIVEPTAEPMAYAEFALEEIADGVVPLHMECAVYYAEETLFNSRTGELVLGDHQYMDLDAMQLASIKPIEELAERGVMRVATHPSPKPLMDPWVDSGHAEWLKATSNAAAAQMVLSGEADACITTGSGLKEAPGLISRHMFGSPVMFFTVATPLNQAQLRDYRRQTLV